MQLNKETLSEVFINSAPLMDVRAPIEYQRGAFPTAINLPLMDNQQRETVGICYNKHGQDQAILKGHELVQGELKNKRVSSWVKFANAHPDGFLYCFRGGLRSKITKQWMQEAGADLPIVEGGYKAMRTFLLNELEEAVDQCSFNLVGGKTGSAKTTLINELNNGIDLEAAAYHRGSSFGRHAKKQNNQINFENIVAIDFLKLRHKNICNIVLEDEARTIGKVGLPKSLFEKMRNSPLVVIEEPYEARLERLAKEYVIEMLAEFNNIEKQSPFICFSNYLLQSLKNIQKRLGPERYANTHHAMQEALQLHEKRDDISGHYDWLRIILDNYYDPMYEDQLKKREEFISFRGNYIECKEYLLHSFQL